MRLMSAIGGAFARMAAAARSIPSGGGGQAYDAARQGRRLGGWQPTSAHINTILSWSGAKLRDRTRDLVRNNPYIRSAVDSFVANAVGAGVKPSSLLKDPVQKDAVRQLFADWTDEADADGLTDFYGLESLGVRAMIEGGEFFVRRRPRRAEDDLVVPLQIQLLESDMLPLEDNRTLPGGNLVKSGIEVDAIGRRVAYHFLRSHPGDVTAAPGGLGPYPQVRVPASEVLHVFKPVRIGQMRGEPQLIASLVRLYLLDQYEDAELERKKIAAMFTTFVKSEFPEDEDPNAVVDPDGTEQKPLQPGTTHYLLPGEDVTLSQPADVGPNFEAFIMRALLAACAGLGVPYSNVTGDLRQANYSSLRAGTVEFRTRLEQFVHNTLVFQMGRPIWQWWMDAAVLSGALALPGYVRDRRAMSRAKWIPPKLPWVDPLKDINAEKAAVDAGFKARSDVIESQGEDPEEVDARIAADHEREKRLGLSFAPKMPMLGQSQGRALDDDEDEAEPPAKGEAAADDDTRAA